MMDYEVFKEVVKEKILDYLPEEYRGASVDIESVNKINQKLDALQIRPSGIYVIPTLYVNDLYEDYKRSEDLQTILQHTADSFAEVGRGIAVTPNDLDMEKIKDNVIMVLVNQEQNREMLQNVPHRPFHDLAVIYRWVITQNEEGMGSVVISNELSERAGLSEEELFQHAVENTKEMLPVKICPITEILMGIGSEEEELFEMLDLTSEELEANLSNMIWVITNTKNINGATSMLYEENLHKLAEKVGSDLYILPSSIHEVMAVSVKLAPPEELLQMVNEVNMCAVKLEDRLSNNVYHYDKDLRKVSLAIDAPVQRLDGKIDEQPMFYNGEPKR